MRSQRVIRLLASAALAAVIATLLFTIPSLIQIQEPWNIVVVSEALTLARITFIVALAHALALGLPLFLLLRSRRRVGVVSCALGGFLVGAVPFALLALTSMVGLQSASSGGKATVVNGVPTLAGWIEYAYQVGAIGLLGLAGGLTFWVAIQLTGQPAAKAITPDVQSNGLNVRSWSIVSGAVLLTSIVLVAPTLVRDNSCHNLFRDGRTSVAPQISADIKLSAGDWATLRQIFVDFAAAYPLSLRVDEQVRRGNIVWRSLSLCSESGINISAVDQPWLTQLNSPLADRGINFSVYELKPGSDWRPLARDLLTQIDMAWPHVTTFRGPDGKVIVIEEALKGRS